MNTTIKFGLAALAVGAFSILPGKADNTTPDSFTRHGLPIPGAYFKNKESQQLATIAVKQIRKSVGQEKQTISKSGQKHTKHVRPAHSRLLGRSNPDLGHEATAKPTLVAAVLHDQRTNGNGAL